MKYVVGILLAMVITLSCSEDSDPGSSQACGTAKTEAEAAVKAYTTKVNAHPGANAAPSVLTAHETEVHQLRITMEAKVSARSAACN
jgi:hypothetical protein